MSGHKNEKKIRENSNVRVTVYIGVCWNARKFIGEFHLLFDTRSELLVVLNLGGLQKICKLYHNIQMTELFDFK